MIRLVVRQVPLAHLDVLTSLRLEAGRVVAEVNSARRADRLKREIARRLGRTAALIDTTVVDPSEAVEARARQRAVGERHDKSAPEPSPELQAIEEEMIREHWEGWLDTRVPALANKTPRQAARTASGRERLEALLAEFDREAVNGRSSMAAHLAAIRDALALAKPPGSGQDTSVAIRAHSRRSMGSSLSVWDQRCRSCGTNDLEVVTLTFASWNRIQEWLRRLDALRCVA